MPPIDWPELFARLHAAEHAGHSLTPLTRARLERARSLIHAEFAEPLDLDALARAAYFSRHHFLREFRREFELTPHQYLTRRRLEIAKQLLANTDLSVTEVCLAVGFSSLGSFSTLFRKHVGRSPAGYRARLFASAKLPPRPPVWIPSCFMAHYGNFREASSSPLGVA
jgi:AraC-like DNA-binding protein